MAGRANRDNVKPMIYIIPIVMMILVCLLATMYTLQRIGSWYFTISYLTINGICGLYSVWMIIALGSQSQFGYLFTFFSLPILINSLGGFKSNFFVLVILSSYVSIFAILTNTVKPIFPVYVFVKIFHRLINSLVDTIWAIANFTFRFLSENKTPLAASCLFVVTQAGNRAGVKDNNTIAAKIRQLFCLRDRNIIAQIGGAC